MQFEMLVKYGLTSPHQATGHFDWFLRSEVFGKGLNKLTAQAIAEIVDEKKA